QTDCAGAVPPFDDHVPLIGRELETDRLRDWLTTASSGSSQVALLTGAMGAGKSRLVAELARMAAPVPVLQGHCYDGEQIVPFGVWIDALRTRALLDDRSLLDKLDPLWRAALVRVLPERGGAEKPVARET